MVKIEVNKHEYKFLQETERKAQVNEYDDLWAYEEIIKFVRNECAKHNELDKECYAMNLFDAYHNGYECIQYYYFKAPDVGIFTNQFGNNRGSRACYLNYFAGNYEYSLNTKNEASGYQTQFRKEEIDDFMDKYSKYLNFDEWEMIPVD